LRSSTKLYAALLVIVTAGFIFGAIQLLMLRYAAGDVYPPYSTYRADPLGAKAYYEALASVPDRVVRRNVEPLGSIRGNHAFTLFLNGLTFPQSGAYLITPESLDADFARGVDAIINRGGRAVLAFAPIAHDEALRQQIDEDFERRMDERLERSRLRSEREDRKAREPEDKENAKKKAETKPESEDIPFPPKTREEEVISLPPADKPESEKSEDEEKSDKSRSDKRSRYADLESPVEDWREHWKVSLEFGPLDRLPQGTYEPVLAKRTIDGLPLPEELLVHSSLYFAPKSDEWKVLYAHDGKAVVLERAFDEGSLVLVADAYIFSNEALRKERNPELLAWLAGTNREIVFDEVALGVMRQGGLVTLMWKYRMQGIFIALIVLALLYIWKNGQPLVPPYEDALPTDAYAYVGKDSASGFVNLLRRSVPRKDVLRTCMAEFEKSYLHRQADFASSLRDAKAILFREDNTDARNRDLVKSYREICELFSKHRLR